jgi:GntR family transcriptional regulator/MocR family aminotransferase
MDYQLLYDQFLKKNESSYASAQRRLHACLRNAIYDGYLIAGMRLPSTRTMAQELNIARNTVVYAYEQLATEGFIISTHRGSVVASVVGKVLKSSVDHVPAAKLDAKNESFAQRSFALSHFPIAAEEAAAFAPGIPALQNFPITLWRRLLDNVWRELHWQSLNYADGAGELSLRKAIADYLRISRAAQCDEEQIFITEGTQHSLDICARVFADSKDRVWMENPGYVGAHIAFQSAQLRTIGINVDEAGIAPSKNDWIRNRPKLIYVTPSHQYPTGSVLSLERRLQLITQALEVGALIIEDDYDSEFRHEGPPLVAMQGLVPNAPVIYLGTFSKTLFPALRIAYMVLPKSLTAHFSTVLLKSSLRGRSAEQMCLAAFIRDGHFATHLRRMRRLYKQRRDVLVALVQQHLSAWVTIHGESSGMHLSLRFLQMQMNDQEISRQAHLLGIVAPALSTHKVGLRKNMWQGLVLGYAQVPVERMPNLIRDLLQLFEASCNSARRN